MRPAVSGQAAARQSCEVWLGGESSAHFRAHNRTNDGAGASKSAFRSIDGLLQCRHFCNERARFPACRKETCRTVNEFVVRSRARWPRCSPCWWRRRPLSPPRARRRPLDGPRRTPRRSPRPPPRKPRPLVRRLRRRRRPGPVPPRNRGPRQPPAAAPSRGRDPRPGPAKPASWRCRASRSTTPGRRFRRRGPRPPSSTTRRPTRSCSKRTPRSCARLPASPR